MVNFLTILLLGKPFGTVCQYLVSVLSQETDNLQFLNRDKKKREIVFQRKNMSDARIDLGTACIRSGNATDQATAPGYCVFCVDMYLERILTNASFVLTTAKMADMLHVYSFAFGLHECLEQRSFSLKT